MHASPAVGSCSGGSSARVIAVLCDEFEEALVSVVLSEWPGATTKVVWALAAVYL